MHFIKGLKIELTQSLENLPSPPLGRGRLGGILQINSVIIMRLLISINNHYPSIK